MELKEFIDNAFEKYEESAELIDFKEELLTNLRDRLNSLEATGLQREEALREIEIEFADINKIADQMSLAKKKEVFEVQYMSLRNFITKKQAAMYTILGILFALGLIGVGIRYLSTGTVDNVTSVFIIFMAIPAAGLVYMALTQETITRNPMKSPRALIYAIATLVFLIGALFVLVLVFGVEKSLETALVILIPFAFPSIGVIAYLIITESDYRKNWVLKEAEKYNEWSKHFEDSGNAQTFGLMTAAIWILAIGIFVLLLILKLWLYSWIPFIVALTVMMLLLAYFMKKEK